MHILSLFIILFVVSFSPEVSAVSPPAPLPQTGQVSCFDAAFQQLSSCKGTGQDGEHRAGIAVPSSRFSAFPDVVVDQLTGLMWANTANLMYWRDVELDPDGAVSWLQADHYIAKLNLEAFGNHSDWRLPNINELESLMYQEDMVPTVDYLSVQGITDFTDRYHWSATSLIGDMSGQAWVADYKNGRIQPWDKGATAYVWPVRGPVADAITPVPATGQDSDPAGVVWPTSRFSVVDNGSVSDSLTGLVWAADSVAVQTTGCVGTGAGVSWNDALAFVACLNEKPFLGKSDWRLPNRKELYSIGGNRSDDNASFFQAGGFVLPSIDPLIFWSSTTRPINPNSTETADRAWVAEYTYGGVKVVDKPKANLYNALAVRGGVGGIAVPQVEPPSIPFDVVEKGASSEAVSITIANTEGTGNNLVLSDITKGGGAPGSFVVVTGGSNPCQTPTQVLAPGEWCTVLVKFTPQAAGDFSADIRIVIAGTDAVIVPVSGTGKDTKLLFTVDSASYLTYVPQQRISGTVDAGATVKVKIGEGEPFKVTVDKYGRWSYLFEDLIFGINTVTFIATDEAQNQQSKNVEVTYQPFNITASAQTVDSELIGGTISPAGDSPVTYRGKLKYLIQPSPGFHIEKVLVGSPPSITKKNLGKRSSYTFTNVRANRSIEAVFARNAFKIYLSAGKGGTVTGGNGQATFTKSFSVLYTDTPTVTVTPKDGYAIKEVLVDGASQHVEVATTPFTYTFTEGVSNQHKVRATFTKLPLP